MEVIAKNKMYESKKVVEPQVEVVKDIPSEPMEIGFEGRLLEEVKAAIFLAKQFPRDEFQAEEKIIELCKRQRFAENALYSLPRGGSFVEGITIRMAEALARTWGNIQYSIIELQTKDGMSKMLAYAWDVENNTKSTRQFDVSMTRYTKAGTRNLNSYQECYEVKAGYGARFLRGCILNLIPADIVEMATETIKETLANKYKDVTIEKEKALNFMISKLDLTQKDLENFLNCRYEEWQEKELLSLKFAYNGIKEGQMKVEQMKSTKRQTGKNENITDDEIKELFDLDKGINKLFFYMQQLHRKTVIGKLTYNEYLELKDILQKRGGISG